MKEINQAGSIKNETNRLIAVGDSDWKYITNGTEIRFVSQSELFPVLESKKFISIKDFALMEKSVIKIQSNSELEFSAGDRAIITYKKYLITNIFAISQSGKGYKAGDILTVNCDKYELDKTTNELKSAKVFVDKVSESGAIVKATIIYGGELLSKPDDIMLLSGGSGSGATMHFTSAVNDQRGRIEAQISSINQLSNTCLLKLEYPINSKITEGKISVEKWEIILSKKYLGDTLINKQFQVYRDYTPNYSFNMMLPNSPSAHICYNASMKKVDMIIKQLEDRIKILENQNKELSKSITKEVSN